MANYGLPYQGSKDGIVHKLAHVFPRAENFYDLFGGGFSVTHYMLLHHSNAYKSFHFNELQPGNVQLIRDAIAGRYNYERFKPKWISREDFARDKDTCPYTRIIWSFGNNQKGYLFGREVEADKRSLHQAVVFGDFDANAVSILGVTKLPEHLSIRGRRLACRATVRARGERLDLQQLEQLEQLERLQRLQQLELTSLSYEQVPILPNSVIYCDPPYKGTAEYLNKFDHDKFWQWVREQKNPVFVSEYQAPQDIKTIIAIRHKKTNSQTTTDSVEKLFGNDAAMRALKGAL